MNMPKRITSVIFYYLWYNIFNIGCGNMNIVRRIVAFYIDILVYGFVIIMVVVPLLMLIFNLFVGDIVRNVFVNVFYIIFFIIFSFKDLLYKNASVGKKILHLKVVTDDSKIPCKKIIILRNILDFIWPVNFIILIISGKKMEDWLFKTNVVSSI